MTCLRCAGFMVEYDLIDIDVGSARYDQRLTAWRCVNCGYISEAHMGANRLANQSGLPPRGRPARLAEG
jgi:hypothetical protein